jgi:hypothetical protein
MKIKSIERAMSESFKGWEFCTASNGDKFALDCNVEGNNVFWVYEDESGNLYESEEEPCHRIDMSGAPIEIVDVFKIANRVGYFD